MLYVIRDAQKRPVATFGTAVAPDGVASEIPPQQIQSQATGSWTSPVTGGVYPSGWQVSLPDQVSLTLTPLLKDQELVTARSTGVAYWEGAIGVSGMAASKPVAGEGYVVWNNAMEGSNYLSAWTTRARLTEMAQPWFDVVEIIPGTSEPAQAMSVLRAR